MTTNVRTLSAALAAAILAPALGVSSGREKAPTTGPATRPADKAFQAFAKKQSVPTARVPQVKKAPKIDGILDPLYKKEATPLSFRFLAGGQARPKATTTVYALTTDTDLIVFFNCGSPDMDALLADVRDRDGQVWNDDSVELFIDPTNKRAPDGYRHIIINSLGTTAEAKGPGGAEDYSWNPKLRVKTKVGRKAWTVEVAIPLKALVADVKKINRVWAVNFNRMAYLIEGTEDTAWSPTGAASSHVPARFGCLWMEVGTVDNTK